MAPPPPIRARRSSPCPPCREQPSSAHDPARRYTRPPKLAEGRRWGTSRRGALLLALGAAGLLMAAEGCTGKPPVEDSAEAAPELELVDTAGARVRLADLSGQVVLVNVWATWCAPCVQEIPALVELHAQQAPRGFTVVGVSIDAAKHDGRVADFAEEFSIPYPIWRDPESTSLQALRGDGLPVSVLVDRRGKLRWKHVGLLDVKAPEFVAALERALSETP